MIKPNKKGEMKKIFLVMLCILTGSVFGQNYIDLDELPPVSELMEQVTPDADTVILCTNGGPIAELETDYFTFYHSIPTFSTVYVKQYQQYNPAIMDDSDLTLEDAIICNDTGVAILRKVVNHFNDLGKTVVITGHSFGAFLIPEYLDDYGNEDVHRVIPMAGRLNMNPEVWEAFATGYWAGFETDGETVWVNDEMEDPSQLAGMKLMAGYGYNRHIDSLAALDLTNLMYLFGTNDEAVGGLLEEEITFLNLVNASVVTVEGGDHGSMFGATYMNQALSFIRESYAVGITDFALEQDDLKVYPTVSTGNVVMEVSNPGTVNVFNSAGMIFMTQTCESGTHQLYLEDLSPGIYIVSYQNEQGGRSQERIVIN